MSAPERVEYPPTDHRGWRRRAAALADLYTALASAQLSYVGHHEEWNCSVDPEYLPRWLDLVDALVPPAEPGRLHYTIFRAWTSDPVADHAKDDDYPPTVYLELASSDRELGLGIGAEDGSLRVVAPLASAGETLVRAEHPELSKPRAEVELDRATWLRYARRSR